MTPIYQNTYAFVNDFPALLESVPDPPEADDELFQMSSAKGICKVMCFHPKSNVTIALMTIREIKEVVKRLVRLEQVVSFHIFGELNTLQQVDLRDAGAGREVVLGADIREQRRSDGLQQRSPPLPDMG